MVEVLDWYIWTGSTCEYWAIPQLSSLTPGCVVFLSRCLHWTGRACVPSGRAAVRWRGSDLRARAAADQQPPASTLQRRAEQQPAGAAADAPQHLLPSAALQGQAAANHRLPPAGKVTSFAFGSNYFWKNTTLDETNMLIFPLQGDATAARVRHRWQQAWWW